MKKLCFILILLLAFPLVSSQITFTQPNVMYLGILVKGISPVTQNSNGIDIITYTDFETKLLVDIDKGIPSEPQTLDPEKNYKYPFTLILEGDETYTTQFYAIFLQPETVEYTDKYFVPLTLPYDESLRKIKIMKNGITLVDKNIRDLLCEAEEITDCPIKFETPREEQLQSILFLVLAVIIIIPIVFIIKLRSHKHMK